MLVMTSMDSSLLMIDRATSQKENAFRNIPAIRGDCSADCVHARSQETRHCAKASLVSLVIAPRANLPPSEANEFVGRLKESVMTYPRMYVYKTSTESVKLPWEIWSC